jgi:hexosaminidase
MGVENVFKANHNIIPPSLVSPFRIFTDNYVAELRNNRLGGKIFYTTDGSEPNENSKQYTAPFRFSETCTIKAFTKWEDAQSRVISYQIEKKDVMPAMDRTN